MVCDRRATCTGDAAVSDVVINGRFLTRPATGVDRFAIELLRAWLPRFGSGAPLKTLIPSQSEARDTAGLNLSLAKVGTLGGHLWEQIELSRHCGEDMLLSLCNTGPITRSRQLAVLHDAGVMARPRTY